MKPDTAPATEPAPVSDADLAGAKPIQPFKSYQHQLTELVAVAEGALTLKPDDPASQKLARQARLKFREHRIGLEKARQSLVTGRKRELAEIDAEAKRIRELFESWELKLQDREDYAAKQEEARVATLKREREDAVRPYLRPGIDPANLNLHLLDVPVWEAQFADIKVGHEDRLKREAEEAAAAAETARKDKLRADRRLEIAPYSDFSAPFIGLDLGTLPEEQFASMFSKIVDAKRLHDEERQQQYVENERLRAEAEAREARIAAERDEHERKLAQERAEADERAKVLQQKADAEKAALEEVAMRKQREADLVMFREREAREAAEAELAAQRQHEADAAAAKLAAEQKAALAPDKEKLRAFAATVRALPIPELSTDRDALWKKLAQQCIKFADWIETQAASLGAEPEAALQQAREAR